MTPWTSQGVMSDTPKKEGKRNWKEQGTLFCSMTQTLELKGRRAFIVAC